MCNENIWISSDSHVPLELMESRFICVLRGESEIRIRVDVFIDLKFNVMQ